MKTIGSYIFIISCLIPCLLLVAILPVYAQDSSECSDLAFPDQGAIYDFKQLRSQYSTNSYRDMPIGKIEIKVLPVFNPQDPDENNPLYMFVNGIHSPTMDYVVRRHLLFNEGDALDPRLIEESERILRDNSYHSDAIILPARICNGRVDLVVVVRDLWTLMPKLIFSRKGGNNKYGLVIEDENILGTGNNLYVEYINDRERDTSSVGYSTRQLFGTRFTLSAVYSDATDGANKSLEITRPFYSLNTRWSVSVSAEEFRYAESLEALDEDINAFDHFDNNYFASVGYSPGLQDGYTRRFSLGFARTEDVFQNNDDTLLPVPTERKLTYPWVEFSIVEDAFEIYRNLNALYRTEDVPVGIGFSALLGYADKDINSSLPVWVFSLGFHDAPVTVNQHLLRTDLDIDGFWDRKLDDYFNTVSTLAMSYYWLFADRQRAYLNISYDYGENLTQDYLLPLGGDEGLRGYPSEYLLGDRRMLINLEYRYFFDVHFVNLLRFAGVLFYDVGKTEFSNTYSNAGFGEDSGTLSSAGFGIRINSSKTNISRIVHLDLAFPLDNKDQVDDYQLTITSDATF